MKRDAKSQKHSNFVMIVNVKDAKALIHLRPFVVTKKM
jgi:hypothetical protein